MSPSVYHFQTRLDLSRLHRQSVIIPRLQTSTRRPPIRKVSYIQTRLCRSENAQLGIVKPEPEPRRQSILDLPNELLLQIIEHLAPWYPSELPPQKFAHYRGSLALQRTCRRFNNLVTPVLYHTLMLETHGRKAEKSYRSARLLRRTLQDNHLLGRYCQRLHMSNEIRPLSTLCDIAASLPNVTHFTFRLASFTSRSAWSVVSVAVQTMPKLEALKLRGDLLLGLFLVMDSILPKAACLRSLQLECTTVRNWAAYTTLRHIISKKSYYPITTLTLWSFNLTARAVQQIMLWPMKLVSFSIADPRTFETAKKWDLKTVIWALAPHKSSLQKLSAGELSIKGLARFDLSEFENLEELTLSSMATGYEFGNEKALFSPNLQRFCWSFVMADLTDFGAVQEEWIRIVCRVAVARKKWCQIHIAYRAGYLCHGLSSSIEFARIQGYPWDRMDRLAEEFRGRGIAVTHDEPFATREEYEKMVDLVAARRKVPRSSLESGDSGM